MAQINVTNLNDKGFDNPAATEDDGSTLRPDLVISVQPRQNDATRAELPVSTADWRSAPRGQFIPVHGVDFLIGVSTLQIQQTVELDDLISRIDSENRYIVRVPNGESLYLASEVSSSTQRCLCGSGRAFVMHLHDNTRQEAMQLQRRLAAASCCFPCRLQEMKVITPPGDYIGRVQQQCTWVIPFFLVRDANDQTLFAIEGPAVMKRSALMLSEFKIMTGDSLREVGKIAHGWDRDLVSFTTTLTMPNTAVQPRHKALLLAASFLLSIEWHSGSFALDAMHGPGEYRWRFRGPDGRCVSYEGHVYMNQLHGYGAMSYPDGKVFTGLFYNDVRYGPGVESFANAHANVGLWRGTRLARLAWRPTAAVTPDILVWPGGRALVNPHRSVLDTTYKTFGKVNQAIEYLKQHGSDPVTATANWTRLYPKHCTDTASQLCHVDFFQHHYYKGQIRSLKQQGSELENDEELENESQDSLQCQYYAWNNNEVAIDMMKHSFQHDRQRDDVHVDLVAILSGYRNAFKPPAIHELDCRTLLIASYLGHVASTTYLVNERAVDPNIADMMGNTALMYATCGDQPELIKFLIEAGASVNSINDSCCSALGIALIRYACARRDVPLSGIPQAFVPPPIVPPVPPEPQTVFDWNLNRDPQTTETSKNTLSKTPSKLNKANMKNKSLISVKDQQTPNKKKTEVMKPIEEEPESMSDESLNNEDKLYRDIYSEYIVKVNDLFETVGQPVTYLFELNNMVDEINDEQQKGVQVDKNPKKKVSKVLKETTKPSKEVISHSGQREDGGSQTSVEVLKAEACDRILLTILQLLANGADPNLVKCPQPALFLATVAGCARLIGHLARYGANVNEVYPQLLNYTPLDIAVSQPMTQSMLETVRALLVAGARADRRLPSAGQGPTLLHAVMARRTDTEAEEDVRRQIMQLLLQYNCDPLERYNGRSAFEGATKNLDFLDIIIRSPRTDLNAAINDSNQTILVKMFHMPYFRILGSFERSQTLTNLLLFGADPLLECEQEGIKHANLFVMATKTMFELSDHSKAIQPGNHQHSSKTKLNETKGSQKPTPEPAKGKKEPKKEETATSDDVANLKQAIDLMRECSRILYIRWLQAKLAKELVHNIARYKQRHWSMIIKEHKNKKASSLWLTAQRSLEIWSHLQNTKIKIYKDKDILWRLLCMSHFYHLRSMTKHGFDRVTAAERDETESYVNYILKEYKKSELLSLQRYVQPELFVNADSKFKVCFECFLPLNDTQIACKSCRVVSFCDMECLKESIEKSNGHACNDYLVLKYLPSPTNRVDKELLDHVQHSLHQDSPPP